ncbi:MAG: hypothetical protein JXA14_13020 [Anaerolineae bacterium]|nr:hypothetical protein [Anaerolineae bacterium]
MKIESQRGKEIDAYLSSHPQANVGRWPIEIGGQKNIMDFYSIPVDLLCYNANNGRLAMDVREWEQTNGQVLDGRQPADAKILREMLLTLDPDKTETLSTDLRRKGQMEPGVVTYDGIVINGNRRMAVLERLHAEEPTGKWTVLEAVRLPQGVSEKDLWRIEAGLQLSKDKVAEYHPVNELLKIKEGIDRGLSPDEVAAAMYAWKVSEIKDALTRLQLIDNFLIFFGQPGNYGAIKKFGLHEYFIDVQRRVIAPARRQGVRRAELNKRLQFTFALIRAGIIAQSRGKTKRRGFTHWDIRNLDRVFSDAHAKAAFTEQLEKAKDMRSIPEEKVIEGFHDAIEALDMREERNRPVRLIERAINALESIDRESEHFCCDTVKQATDRLSELVNGFQKQLAEWQAGQ